LWIPLDVVGRILLKVRVPGRLVGEDDLAVNHRGGLPVAAAEVESDPVPVKVAAQGQSRGALNWKRLNSNRFDAEDTPIDPLAHERMVEGPCARRAVDRREMGRDLGRSRRLSDGASALLPKKEFEQALSA
jgi:hypothetical protein